MSRVHAYIGFDGNCQQAMNFYQDALGGELFVQLVSESPIAAQMPDAMQHKVVHAQLEHGNLMLMASDMTSSDELRRGQSVSLMLVPDTLEEAHAVFDKLSVGGTVRQPLSESFWGATFGDCVDPYGVTWMVNYTKA